MASITCCGTCVPPGPSRKTAGCLLTVCASAGNCERTQVRSNAVDEEEACSAIGIADILNEEVEANPKSGHERRRIRRLLPKAAAGCAKANFRAESETSAAKAKPLPQGAQRNPGESP